jgi:hypothetical protein
VRDTPTAVVRPLAANARSFVERHGYDMDGGSAVRPLLAPEYPGGEPLERMIPEEAHEEFL